MGLQPSVRRRPECRKLTSGRLQHNQSSSRQCHRKAVKWRLSSLKWAIAPIQHHVGFLNRLFDNRHKPTGCRLVWIMQESLCPVCCIFPNLFDLTREWKDAFVCFGSDRKLHGHKWTWKWEQSAKLTIGMQGIWYECWIIEISKRVRYL